MRLIIYDEKNLGYVVANDIVHFNTYHDDIEVTELVDTYRKFIKSPFATMTFNVLDIDNMDDIKLDPTLMKRIAIYNKEQECKRLDAKIKEKKNKIKELDDKLNDREQRWKKIQEYVSNIYELDLQEYEDDDYYDD